MGFKKNFEKAINLCTGDYIALSDQDDVWEKKHLELLMEAIGEKNLACGNSLMVNQYCEPLGITLKEQEALDFIPDDDFAKLKSILLFRNPYQGATMLFKRDLLKYILPFPDTVDYHDTWIASVACVTGGLVYVDEVLLKYRRIANSVTGWRTKRKSKIKSFAHAWLFEDRIGIIDELLLRVDSISNIQIKKLQFYKSLIINNTKIRKPFTIMCLLFDYKSIYSCDNLHWF